MKANDNTLVRFEFGDPLLGIQKRVIQVFRFKLGKAVCLVGGWRISFLVGLQDLSTLVSPGMTRWSWSILSTAPRR